MVMRRLLARLGLWCLNRAGVPAIEGRVGAPDGPPDVKVYVFREGPWVAGLLLGIAQTYARLHGIEQVEVEREEPKPPLPQTPLVH